MKTLFVVAIASVLLTGCGWFDRKLASVTGYSKICIDGVTYIQFASGATPQYTVDGKLVSCK